MANFYTLLTPIGLAKVTNAQITQSKVAISHIAVGDSNGTNYPPTGNETALKKEKWRGGVSSVAVDAANPNWIVVEAILPATVGGFTLREVALYDEVGDMIAIGNYPDTYKPVASDGSTMDLLLRTIIEVSNADSVTLKIDPNVIVASRKYVDDKIAPIQTQITNHAAKSASAAHGQIRKEYMLFQGALATGSATLSMPAGFATLSDFDEIIISGTMNNTSSSTWKHFCQRIDIKNTSEIYAFAELHEILYTAISTSDVFWIKANLSKTLNTLVIVYNRKKVGANNGVDVTENVISQLVGVKYE
ncbi:putative tail-collar fiber protein [uncultured Caudovirales phage]|uniref:Putative tail-collar fiber protein n=1 Tax=uncultured Caudovirales phage TaxID=2100421 RepID=A0A2H4J194_9CAUD|nr:putative tail-collar fiber protein [uncultured Caudovirales phage]